MDYFKHYNLLMEKAKNRDLSGYTETHHIVPRCMGGSDLPENLVRLTAREHFIAHALLYKAYKTPQLAHAWFMMTVSSDNQKRHNSRLYELCRSAHIQALKETMRGEGNPFHGKKHSKKTLEKISKKVKEALKDKEPTEAMKDARRRFIELSKQPKNKEHKKKIGRKGLIMVYNPKTMVYNRIPKEDLAKYPEFEVIDHRNKEKTCKKCGFKARAPIIARWHNENCTQAGNYKDKSKIRKTSRRMQSVSINGKVYRSLTEASRELGISRTKVKKLNEN